MPAPSDDSWEVSLARLEGKLDAIIASNAALTVSVSDLDRQLLPGGVMPDMSATTKADGRTLPWRILGRQVRPYALAELDAAIRDAEV